MNNHVSEPFRQILNDAWTDKARIVTCHHYPPIPLRCFDWSACREGNEEDGPFGWGRTQEEAIRDLEQQEDEASDV